MKHLETTGGKMTQGKSDQQTSESSFEQQQPIRAGEITENTDEKHRTREVTLQQFEAKYFSHFEKQVNQLIEAWQRTGGPQNEIAKEIALLQRAVKQERHFCHQVIELYLKWKTELLYSERTDPTIILWGSGILDHPILTALITFQEEIFGPDELSEDLRNGAFIPFARSDEAALARIADQHSLMTNSLDPRYVYHGKYVDIPGTHRFDYYFYRSPNGAVRRESSDAHGPIGQLLQLKKAGHIFS